MQMFKKIFVASLFLVFAVLLAIWFYPGVQNAIQTFNSNVQGNVGPGEYLALATGALDITLALLRASAAFYGVFFALHVRKKRTDAG